LLIVFLPPKFDLQLRARTPVAGHFPTPLADAHAANGCRRWGSAVWSADIFADGEIEIVIAQPRA
jgi:hypothetical protein